jgi:hypothetical protein
VSPFERYFDMSIFSGEPCGVFFCKTSAPEKEQKAKKNIVGRSISFVKINFLIIIFLFQGDPSNFLIF